jgi:hypothetical protein
MLNRRQFMFQVPAMAGLAATVASQTGPRVRQIDIVHHTHLDVGYTDQPSVVREKQKRYLDAAIDLCRADKTFRWTVETLVEFDDWWRAASAAQRGRLLAAVAAGQIDVMGLPFNQTPFLNALQWRQMMSWIPAEVWRRVNPRAAMQNDVNGFPRAGAMLLLDRGIRHLLMGLNADSGGPPFRRPSAFWWKMPDQRQLFIWLGDHYGRAMAYLKAPPQGFTTDEPSLRAAHANCLERLQRLEQDGYEHDRLILTFTNPLSYDNGWPYPTLAPFIAAWNALGLKPALRLVTATQAVLEMEKAVGGKIPVLEGEWTDWWANGAASGPREVAASRFAKRHLAAALSPVWGPLPQGAAPEVEAILKDLCLFDEHTWGGSNSISAPYSLRAQGQYTEKSELAYRPMTHAEWLLARRWRTKLAALPEGVYAVNPAPSEISGWATISDGTPGGEFRSLVETATGARLELVKDNRSLRFWVEKLPPRTIAAFRPDTVAFSDFPGDVKPAMKLDDSGWPVSATWPEMAKPLFAGSFGEFLSVSLVPPANRATIAGLHANPDAEKRAQIRQKSLRQEKATYGAAQVKENAHTLVYTQEMRHPRIDHARRSLELWKREARARLTVQFDRLSSTAPELFYLAFAFPQGLPLPVFSCGGVPFTPYRDQLPGSCRDYFAIDGWAHYPAAEGHWLWVTRDAPLAVVGGPHALERHQAEPPDIHRLLSMIFDNCWHTNFVANSEGTMEFQYDLVWSPKIANPGEAAEALATEPVVAVNGGVRESPVLVRDIYQP